MSHRGEERRGIPEKLGQFRLLERLGAGGMGVVYRARDELLSRDVALKLILPEHLAFDETRERFRREVEAAAKLQHPGIVPVYSVGQEGSIPYFAMELVEGTSLAGVIESFRDRRPSDLTGADMRAAIQSASRRFDSRQTTTTGDGAVFASTWVQACCRLVLQVADALLHAHASGVVHRDVKPSNVIVTPSGRAMLLDFGVASTEEASRLTRTGSQVGSLPYMPPERLRGEAASGDPRGDVYSLGVTLYEILTLKLPFDGRTIQETLRAVLAGDCEPVAARNPSVPWDAATVCATAMEREPERRYPTAEALALDLKNLLELRPIGARAASRTLRLKRWIQRNPTLSVGAALSFLLLVVAPSIALWNIRKERDVALRELRTREEMLSFVLDLFRSADPSSGNPSDRTVYDLLDEGARSIRTAFGGAPEVRVRLLHDLASIQGQLGRPREAADLAREALHLFHETHGEDESLGTALKRTLAVNILLLGESDEGTRLLEEVRVAALRGSAEDSKAAFECDIELSMALLVQGRAEEARRLLEQVATTPAFEREVKTYSGITWLTNMAQACRLLGENDRSMEFNRRALDTAREIYGDEHERVANALQNLAVDHSETGSLEEALRLLLEARDVRSRLYANASIDDARLEFNLGALYTKLERHGESADAHQRALALCRDLAGDSIQTARAAAGLGAALTTAGRPAEAEPVLREALDLGRRFIPQQGLPAIGAPIGLARCLVALGRGEEAVPFFEEALGLVEDDPAVSGARLAKWEGELASVLEVLGRTEEAARRRDRGKRALEGSEPSKD